MNYVLLIILLHGSSTLTEKKLSNSSIAQVTAAIAGDQKFVKEWVTAREQAARIEVLLNHHVALGLRKCATNLDEPIGSQRTKKHRTGTSGKIEVSRRLEEQNVKEIFWRDVKDIEQANAATVRSLRKGLTLAREEVVKKSVRALGELPDVTVDLTKGVQIIIDRIRGKEIKKCNEKLQIIVNKTNNCENHIVCKWMRSRVKKWNQEKVKQEQK